MKITNFFFIFGEYYDISDNLRYVENITRCARIMRVKRYFFQKCISHQTRTSRLGSNAIRVCKTARILALLEMRYSIKNKIAILAISQNLILGHLDLLAISQIYFSDISQKYRFCEIVISHLSKMRGLISNIALRYFARARSARFTCLIQVFFVYGCQ